MNPLEDDQAAEPALAEAARLRREQKLKVEAQALAADPDDRTEIAAVQKDMESLRAWWGH